MKFGIHNSSWLERPDPGEAFETVNAKAQWAEDHGFVWFSVLDHMIQIPRVHAFYERLGFRSDLRVANVAMRRTSLRE
jgi:hypothetical protein